MNRTASRSIFCALALLICAAPALAGPLATDATSIWHSSTPFGSGSDPLQGYVDYAVYAPGVLPAGFAGVGGYSPSASEYLYTFQVYVTGSAALSELTVFFDNPANNIGDFTATGVSGVTSSSQTLFSSVLADWIFPGVPTGSQTDGLAFTSPFYPTNGLGTVIDHGTSHLVIPLPVPSDQLIPEPSSILLATCGLGLLALQWLRKRVRRV